MKKQSKLKYETREQWLEAAVRLMVPLFEKGKYKVPRVRVSCGWPSSRGLSSKRPAGGECWAAESAGDSVAQVFISPRIYKPLGEVGVLAILAHEVCHAVVGNKAKHGKVFKACATSIGLEGKMTSTTGGKEFLERAAGWVKDLGEYPHAELKPSQRPTKKQTTRMVKCECKDCGYSIRTSRKWLEESGAVLCPCNKKPMSFEIPAELEGEDDYE
jgi:predicted SprT family Zn-dependent metalloprotease